MRRVFQHGAYADRALHAEADRARLEPRERALARRLAYGAIQRRATHDHVIARLAERDPERLDPTLRVALWVGLYELLYLDSAAEHAAVDQAVELAKLEHPKGAGLVNAVLRRATREARALLDALDDETPERAAIRHSHPEWIAALWWEALGPVQARTLMAANNEPAESALRANTLVTGAGALAAALAAEGVATRPAPSLPEGLVAEGRFDAFHSPLWAAGAFMPQSRGSMLVAKTLDPRPGERVLDLCAAPGAKTTHIAALMGDSGQVVAVERHEGRSEALKRTCSRMRITSVEVVLADATRFRGEGFDRVLVDPPCSGLGTLRSRPDLRWRMGEERMVGLVAEQTAILDVAAGATRPSGVLVYSTCTISAAENERQIASLLERHPAFEVADSMQLLPHRDGTDGFFIARLRNARSQ